MKKFVALPGNKKKNEFHEHKSLFVVVVVLNILFLLLEDDVTFSSFSSFVWPSLG